MYMYEKKTHPCKGLLLEWYQKREVANYYMTALLRLTPDELEAHRRRRELIRKVSDARLRLKHVGDQLQSCYQEYGQIV
jgi:hypothetical protein